MSDRSSETFYASLDVFDPDGPGRMEPGLFYGGDTWLFVLAAGSLREALERLAGAVAEKGMALTHLRSAGPSTGFDPECFPVPVDLDKMSQDAQASGQICALPPVSFAPYDVEWTEVSIGVAEVHDPAKAGDTGAYVQFSVRGPVARALGELFAACDREGLELRSVDELQDAALIYEEDEFGAGNIAAAVEAATGTLTWGKRVPVEA